MRRRLFGSPLRRGAWLAALVALAAVAVSIPTLAAGQGGGHASKAEPASKQRKRRSRSADTKQDIALIRKEARRLRGPRGVRGVRGLRGLRGPKGDRGTVAAQAASPESFHVVGAARQPTFQNSWSNYGNGFAPAAFYKDPLGRVHLKGTITHGGASTVAFTLPVGYRPPESVAFAATAGTGTPKTVSVKVGSDGTVFIFNSGVTGGDPVSLDPVSFRAS